MTKINLKGKNVAVVGRYHRLSDKKIKEKLTALGANVLPVEDEKVEILFSSYGHALDIMKAYEKRQTIYGDTMLYKVLELPEDSFEERKAYLVKRFLKQDDATRKELLENGIAKIELNFPHKQKINSFALSNNGKYLATGDDCENYKEGGTLAIWEVATGRLLNKIERVTGGVGWSGDYQGCIQWSPNDDIICIAYNTNGLAIVDPFHPEQQIEHTSFPSNWDHPPHWCFSNNGLPLFVSTWSEKEDEVSPLPGVITSPYERSTIEFQMLETSDDFSFEPFDKNTQPFQKMVWTDDNIIVGFNKRHGQCYAIDAYTRKQIWAKEVEAVAFHPNGKEILIHTDDFYRIDIATGETIETPKVIEPKQEEKEPNFGGFFRFADKLLGRNKEIDYEENYEDREGDEYNASNYKYDFSVGDYHYSPDGSMFVKASNECVHFFRNNEYVQMVHGVKKKGWDTVDLESIAFSLDNQFLAILEPSDQISIWKIGEKLEMVSYLRGATCNGIFFGADNVLIAATRSHLTFTNITTGKNIASHHFHKRPELPSFADKIDGLIHFPMGDTWGYFKDWQNILIADKDLSPYAHIVFDATWTFPLDWANISIFPDLKTAIEQEPDKMGERIIEGFKNWKDPKDVFFEENTHTLQDLEKGFIEFYKAENWDKHRISALNNAENMGETIHYFLRSGQVERGVELLKQMPLDNFQEIARSIPIIIAYLAKLGEKELAQDLIDKIVPLYDSSNNRGFTVQFDAWLGAAGHLLGNGEAKRLQMAFDNLTTNPNRHEIIEGFKLSVGSAYAFIGDFEKALEASEIAFNTMRTDMSLNNFSRNNHLILESNDNDIIQRYLLILDERKNAQIETLEQFSEHFIKVNAPEILLESLPKLKNTDEYDLPAVHRLRLKLLDYIGKTKGVEVLLDYTSEDYIKLNTTSDFGKAAELLAILCSHSGTAMIPLLQDLAKRAIESNKVKPRFMRAMCKILPKLEQEELLTTLYDAADKLDGNNYMDAILHLTDNNDLCRKAFQYLKDKNEVRLFIKHIEPSATYYQLMVNYQLAKTIDSEYDEQQLLRQLLTKGDYENAYTIYSRNPDSRAFHKIIARNAIRQGNFTLGLHFLKELPIGGGTEYYEYEILQALVRDCWDNQNWICDVF
jgi:WD40 repeat protein